MLTSSQNPRVKLARQLQQRREAREREQLFLAEGVRLTDDFIRAGMVARYAFIGASPAAQQWMREHSQVECVEVSDAVMREISLETTPPGVAVVFQIPAAQPSSTSDSDLILILDALRDPGNLGACLRVAAGADCRRVLLAPGSVDPFNPKVVRGGMGAHARLAVTSMDWEAIRATCQGRHVWAADAGGAKRYDHVVWAQPNALIIGGEASGISPDAHKLATGVVSIPLANNVESLNAAVACGVILFEAARQRHTSRGAR